MSTLFVGIDVSMKDFKARFLDVQGEDIAKRKRFTNDLPGLTALVEIVLATAEANQLDQISIGLEATSVYNWPLQMSLASDPRLHQYGCQVYTLNPKTTAHFAKAFGDTGKDDWIDSGVIAERLRFGHLPEAYQVDFRYLPLQRLTRFRSHLMQVMTREKNYFLTNLFLKFNTLLQQEVFSDLFGTTAGAVLTEFLSPEDIAARPLEELIDFLIEKGRGNFDDPQAKAEQLKKAASSAHKLNASLLEPVNLILTTSIETIRCLEKQVTVIDKAISKELAHFSQTLHTVPGLGPVCCAGIIAEVGNIRRFDNEAALAKYAGLTWRGSQSGEFEADDKPLTRTGNSYLRHYLTLAANTVRYHEPEYREFYSRKYKESKTHHHRRALVLTARKLVRLVDALLRSNQIYLPRDQRGTA